MKKMLLVLISLALLLTFVGCTNNDENNAAVQLKIDESDAMVQEIYAFCEDNGLFEGEGATVVKPGLDQLVATMDELKLKNQEIIAGDGYNDEDTVTMLEALDSDIALYTEQLAVLKNELALYMEELSTIE